MELISNKAKEIADEGPVGPIRILVQTMTHLVPGDTYFSRCNFLNDRICQHHWGCDFDPQIHRWSTYGAYFAFDNRLCYFLLDYGWATNNGDDDAGVPILSYEWTGESL